MVYGMSKRLVIQSKTEKRKNKCSYTGGSKYNAQIVTGSYVTIGKLVKATHTFTNVH